ncbi:hypothetical protein FOA52_010492 [Chlamydomonas sp. UWO 241]|nr:hypothetical protein FOA52_010492 [Chlamydomonas sp. UWO 241]
MATIELAVGLQVAALVTATSLVLELLCWAFVYRTSGYKACLAEVEAAAKKLAACDALPPAEAAKKRTKLDEAMKTASTKFSFHAKIKTGLFTMVIMGLLYRFVAASYKGVVVGVLPFDPPGFIAGFARSGLEPGAGDRACSALFIYILCTMCVRGNITKALGLGPSRSVTAAMAPKWPTLEPESDKTKSD